MKSAIAKARENLKPGERFNAMGFYAVRTQREVAKIMGISRGRVYQLERRALYKIRIRLQAHLDAARTEVLAECQSRPTNPQSAIRNSKDPS